MKWELMCGSEFFMAFDTVATNAKNINVKTPKFSEGISKVASLFRTTRSEVFGIEINKAGFTIHIFT